MAIRCRLLVPARSRRTVHSTQRSGWTWAIATALALGAVTPSFGAPTACGYPPTVQCYGALEAGEIGDLVFRTSDDRQIYGINNFANVSCIPTKPGHVGVFIGHAYDRPERMVVESLGGGSPGPEHGVIISKYDLAEVGWAYFMRETTQAFLGALTPVQAVTALQRRNVVLLAVDQLGEGYDEGAGDQKGPGSDDWICSGLAEKVWESANLNGRVFEGDNLPLTYGANYPAYGDETPYAVNITPDGTPPDHCNWTASDNICKTHEFTDFLWPCPDIFFPASMIYRTEIAPITLKDSVAMSPTASPTFDPPQPNQHGWYDSDVTLTAIAAQDAGGSGIRSRRYARNQDPFSEFVEPVPLPDSATVSVKAQDNAGTESIPVSVAINIDKMAPSILQLLPCDGCTVIGSAVTVGGSVAGGGGASPEYVVVDNVTTGRRRQGDVSGVGQFVVPIEVAYGANTLTVTAYDLAGNASAEAEITVCAEADGDGLCGIDDCNDTNPNCTTDCTDADGDGFCVTADSNDANPHCTTYSTDADGDGFCPPLDCDDANVNCTTDCSDGDRDGVALCAGDCNDELPGCWSNCADLDGDGYCPPIDGDDGGATPWPDGVHLGVSKGAAAGEVNLTWAGGQPTFDVFRSTSAANVSDPGNRVHACSERTWSDTPPPASVHFYMIGTPCVVSYPEICDGLDNDCDGTIDEAGSQVSCPRSNGFPVCVAGSCGTSQCAPNWWDLNGNPGDGCEYSCVRQSLTDEPDPSFVDANCDGIDGDPTRAVFVSSTSGFDGNLGTTPDLPVATLARGIDVAVATGRTQVLVTTGSYAGARLALHNGIGVYGNYGPGFTQRSSTPGMTAFTASDTTAVEATNLSSPTVLEHLRLASADATALGDSSYAVHASWSPGLVVRHCVVVAGAGASGASASPTLQAGADGGDGGGGLPGECNNQYDPGFGGSRGGSPCLSTGGVGGTGGDYEDGFQGRAGEAGYLEDQTPGGGAGGAGGPWSGCDPGDGSNPDGQPGAAGPHGAVGSNGSGGAGGSVHGNLWVGSTGAIGTAGAAGGGGGGGGSGAGQHNECACVLGIGCCCTDGAGNGGGGGGGGACGGGGGAGGQAGGGSFGVFLVYSHGVAIVSSSIESRSGGAGGAGAAGGSGGTGGNGGAGYAYCSGEIGDGAAGGRGGDGGDGGDGGGGAGGPSYAIFAYEADAMLTGNTLINGFGGAGGGSPGSPGSPGGSGTTTLDEIVQFDVRSSFNADVIVNDGGGTLDTSQTSMDSLGYCLITQSAAAQLSPPSLQNGLPDDGFFPASSWHPAVQLAYRNGDHGVNAKQFVSNGQWIEFAVPFGHYEQIHVFLTTTQTWANIVVRLSYADGSNIDMTVRQVPDWFEDPANTTERYQLIDGLDRVKTNGTGYHDANDPAIFGLRYDTDPSRVLQRVRVTRTASSETATRLHFFGATGVLHPD